MKIRGDLGALVLAILQDEPLHGYEISKRLTSQTDFLVKVGEGQLYPTLHRLEADGYVEAFWIPQEGKPSRKMYQLTDKGRGELSVRRAEWEKYVNAISGLMAPKPGESHA